MAATVHEAFPAPNDEAAPWWLGGDGCERWTARWLEDNDARNRLGPVRYDTGWGGTGCGDVLRGVKMSRMEVEGGRGGRDAV